MSEPSHAVFLSYASQDADAARKIGEALRAVGIQVFFDQSELRGGDAWDRSIRQHIHDCRLFVPVISAQTDARPEGYFRREWKLAVDRTHDMSERVAFLVPVVIDDTSDARADVPDRFREVQWTRLRPPDRLADRLGIASIVLVRLDVGLDELWRHELYLVAEPTQLARPVMGARARLDTHQARRQVRKEDNELPPAQALLQRYLSTDIDSVQLKD